MAFRGKGQDQNGLRGGQAGHDGGLTGGGKGRAGRRPARGLFRKWAHQDWGDGCGVGVKRGRLQVGSSQALGFADLGGLFLSQRVLGLGDAELVL